MISPCSIALRSTAIWFFGSAVSVLSAITCPVFTRGPSNVLAYYCDFVTFTAEATGTSPLRYQWYRNSSAINGATNSIYITPRPAATYAGLYYVTVQNDGCGAVTSLVANLYVPKDYIPLGVHRSSVLPDLAHILISFHPCPLDPGAISDPSNYEFSGGIVLSNMAILQETNLFLTTSPLAPSTHYNLRISYFRNVLGDPLYPDPTDISLWAPPLQLMLTRSNNTAYLLWPDGGILQRGMQPTGPWTDMAGPTNSATLSSTGFYRVRFP